MFQFTFSFAYLILIWRGCQPCGCCFCYTCNIGWIYLCCIPSTKR